MAASTIPTYTLNDGLTLPMVGFGTYPLRGVDGLAAMRSALDNGYRLLDSAVNYGNEAQVGQAVRDSGLAREQVQVATKIPGRDHEHAKALASVENSLRTTGLDYLDLVLIHWPNPGRGLYRQAWEALIQARERGLVRSIGVSNFTAEHLSRIIEATGVTPALNQIEVHPYFPNTDMLAANRELGVLTQAWSPLGKRQAPFDQHSVQQAAKAHGVSPAQVILRWHLQREVLPLPKSATPARQQENLDVFAFTLTGEQMQAITALGKPDGRLFAADPATHEEL